MVLTDEQKKKIEENRLKALAKRQQATSSNPTPTLGSRPSISSSSGSTLTGSRPLTSTPSISNQKPFLGTNGSHTSASSFQNPPTSNGLLHVGSTGQPQPSTSISRPLPAPASNPLPLKPPITNNQSSPRPPIANLKTAIHSGSSHFSNVSQTNVNKTTFYGTGTSGTANTQGLVGSTSRPSPSQSIPFKGKVIQGDCVLISADLFKVDMAYNGGAIAVFKTLKTARYNASDRLWCFNICDHEELLRLMRPLRPEIEIIPLPRTVVNILDKSRNRKIDVSVNTGKEGSYTIDSNLWDSLMPFQREGVLYALKRNGRIILADDMGLGKTIQAISIARAYKNDWPLLIVCPSSMRFAWKAAILKWIPGFPQEDILVITGGNDYLCNVQILIINYDLLAKKESELIAKKVKVLIFDECHFLKSHKSKRSKVAEAISKNATRLLLLSGTPALSRPMELFSQISIVDPTLFPNPIDFGMRYCDGKKVSFGKGRDHYDFQGSSNMQELKFIMEERCMIRRLKSDVITQLPSKQRQVVQLDPTIVRASKDMQKQAEKMMSKSLSGNEKRGLLLQWFHSTAEAKKKAVLEYIKDLLEGGKKFICFAHHQVMITSIAKLLEDEKVDFVKIDGSTSAVSREQCCQDFQTMDSKRVALLSITAANAGITLTAAQLVVFAELFWNPGILIQAEDRAHRIGQTCSVTIQYLVASGTADDELWPMIQHKLNVLSKVGLSAENFLESDSESFQHVAKNQGKADKKITDYFSSSFTEEELDQIFEDDDFGNEPEIKKQKN